MSRVRVCVCCRHTFVAHILVIRFDQFMDFHATLTTKDLDPLAARLIHDDVPFLVRRLKLKHGLSDRPAARPPFRPSACCVASAVITVLVSLASVLSCAVQVAWTIHCSWSCRTPSLWRSWARSSPSLR